MKKLVLLITLIVFMYGCAGTIRLAEEDKKGSTIPTKNSIVKPNK